MKPPPLLLIFDPRSASGYAALESRPDAVPDAVPDWQKRLEEALAEADRVGLDATEVVAVERHRSDAADMDLLASLEMPAPQYYQLSEQVVIRSFFLRLLPELSDSVNSSLATWLREAMSLLGYSIDNRLLVRIGWPEDVALERTDVLAPMSRRGDPLPPAVLARWKGSGAPELIAAERRIDELLVCAEQLGINAGVVAETEVQIRQQPAPGRLRDDEDIADLLLLAEAVIARVDEIKQATSSQFLQQLNRLEELLRFVRAENLLLATRRPEQ